MDILKDVRMIVQNEIKDEKRAKQYLPESLEIKIRDYFIDVADRFGIEIDGYKVDSYFQVPMVIDKLRELGVIDVDTWITLLNFILVLDELHYSGVTGKDVKELGEYIGVKRK